MVTQSFYSKGAINSGNRFSNLTREKYDSVKEFIGSDNKYVHQFLKKFNRKMKQKYLWLK